MNNWVKGTNFDNHFVGSADPTDQVVVRGGQVFSLPKDYTMLDQLFDQEAYIDLIPKEVIGNIRVSISLIGEHIARDTVIIDNTVSPPEIRQVPLMDGTLSLSSSLAKGLSPSQHSMEEVYG